MELNDPESASEPLFDPAPAPDHGPRFWSALEDEMHADVVAANTVVPGVEVLPGPTEAIPVAAASPGAAVREPVSVVLGGDPSGAVSTDRTEQLVGVGGAAPAQLNERRWAVLAAAAALFLVGLIGFGMLRSDPASVNEVVSSGELTPAAADVATAATGDADDTTDTTATGTDTTESGDSDEADPADASAASGGTSDPAAPTPTVVPTSESTGAATAASQPDDTTDTSTNSDSSTDTDSSADSGTTAAAQNDSASTEPRFLVQNDQQVLYFAETVATGATDCAYANQNAITIKSPSGESSSLAGRLYPHIVDMTVSGEYFALISATCDGAQMLEVGRMESDGRLISSSTMRGHRSDGSPAIFRNVTLDAASGFVSYEDAPVDTSNFSPQRVEIDPPLRPTPTPEPTATPEPLPALPDGSTFADRARLIGSTANGDIDWFAVADEGSNCLSNGYSQIMVIAGDGPANTVHSPQFRYSGDIGFFAVNGASTEVAFVAACGSQIELHVATLGAGGTFVSSDLAWVGLGSPDNSLVVWDDAGRVTLNSLQPDSTPFFVEYEPATGRITDTNIPSRSAADGGSPAGLYPSPIGASPNGAVVYYNGSDPDGTGGCDGESNTLWAQTQTGDWVEAIVTNPDLRVVTSFALHSSSAQVAFADACDGLDGTIYIGLVQADGLITNLRTVSLEAFVPGFASNLFWIDASRLRIDTDNAALRVDAKRFEFDLRGDVMVQLDR